MGFRCGSLSSVLGFHLLYAVSLYAAHGSSHHYHLIAAVIAFCLPVYDGETETEKKDMKIISRWVFGCSEGLGLRPLDKKVHKSRNIYCVSGIGIWYC